MRAKKESNIILFIFIIVLILHTTLMWLLIKVRSSTQSPQQDLEKPSDRQSPQKPWVKLQSPPSSPVLFKTMPQITPTPPSQPLQITPLDNNQTPSPQETKQDQKAEQKTPPKPEQKFVTQKGPATPLALPKEEAHSVTKQTPEIKQTAPATPPQEQQAAASKSSKLSFTNLMQGFANHLEQEATDEYTMRGKTTGKATAEQIRYAQYGSKICSTIHNAFLTNNHKSMFATNKGNTLVVKIIIDKSGSLLHTQVMKSSESAALDQLILTVINSAAQSFPPLPQFFNMEQCPFVITINNALQVIEHPEQSYWTL